MDAVQVEMTQRHVTYESLVKGLMDKGYSPYQAEQAVDAFLDKIDGYMQRGLDFKQSLEQLQQDNQTQLKISENARIQSENLLKAKNAEIAERQARYDRLIKNGVDPEKADQQVYGKDSSNSHTKRQSQNKVRIKHD